LVDALAFRDLSPLVHALGKMDWVVHGAKSDLRIFRDLGMQHAGQLWDVQIVHGLTRSSYPLRLDELARSTIGTSGAKDLTMSDWSARPLTRRQRRYATDDVDYLLEIAEAQRKDRSPEACDELAKICTEELNRLVHEPAPADTWHDVPGSHLLNARGIAVLKDLLCWRKEEAVLRGLPLHFVLGNPLLFYLSRRQPREYSDLEENRRFPRPILRQHGETLLHVIGKAMTIPEEQLPNTAPHDARFLARSSYLTAWATAYGLARGTHPALLLPATLNAALARGEPVQTVLSGWRAERFGAALESALAGDSAIRLDGESLRLEPQAS
jgi:ribonuclease D